MPRDLPSDITHPSIAALLSRHSISLEQWTSARPEYGRLVVGAFILRPSPTDRNQPQLLLLQRAATDSYPNIWEPPGGSVDQEDETIMHGLVREVWEETGLRIAHVRRQLWDGNGDGSSEVTFMGKRGDVWCKLNFLIEVVEREDGEVAVSLDEAEHQDWGWFTEEAMEKLPFVSMQGREIARNAFVAFRSGLDKL